MVRVEEGGKVHTAVARTTVNQFEVQKGSEIEQRGELAKNDEGRGPRWNCESARCAPPASLIPWCLNTLVR